MSHRSRKTNTAWAIALLVFRPVRFAERSADDAMLDLTSGTEGDTALETRQQYVRQYLEAAKTVRKSLAVSLVVVLASVAAALLVGFVLRSVGVAKPPRATEVLQYVGIGILRAWTSGSTGASTSWDRSSSPCRCRGSVF